MDPSTIREYKEYCNDLKNNNTSNLQKLATQIGLAQKDINVNKETLCKNIAYHLVMDAPTIGFPNTFSTEEALSFLCNELENRYLVDEVEKWAKCKKYLLSNFQVDRYIENLDNNTYKKAYDIAILYQRYFDNPDEQLMKDAPHQNKTYDMNSIRNWDDIVLYFKTFMQGKIYSNVFHSGPLNAESLLISKYLIEFYNYGIITHDSQPGLIFDNKIENDLYIQVPYLFLVCPDDKYQELYNHFINNIHPYIRIETVDDTVEYHTSLFPKLPKTISESILRFGTIIPDNPDDAYWNFIFSDQFFKDILDVVKSIQ